MITKLMLRPAASGQTSGVSVGSMHATNRAAFSAAVADSCIGNNGGSSEASSCFSDSGSSMGAADDLVLNLMHGVKASNNNNNTKTALKSVHRLVTLVEKQQQQEQTGELTSLLCGLTDIKGRMLVLDSYTLS